MQVVAKTISGTVVVNCTIAVRITLSVMIVFFIAKTIRPTISAERTFTVRRALSVERVFVAIPINLTIRITRAMPIMLTRLIGPWSWTPWIELYQAALNCETGKDNKNFVHNFTPHCLFHKWPTFDHTILLMVSKHYADFSPHQESLSYHV